MNGGVKGNRNKTWIAGFGGNPDEVKTQKRKAKQL
jgi:hypothetical protein